MTQPDSSPDIKSIFGRALELNNPNDRDAYLDGACAHAPDMRSEVDELLAMHEGAKGFMPRPAVALNEQPTAATSSIPDMTGTIIGPYKLLQVIGEGGMGVVYMAEQQEPVRRKVALKIIKPGMDSKQVIARFEAERQALAMMDHVNIAKVLEAGTTDKKLPYFVMELVQGVPITEYCDANQLSPRKRLDLFVPVCRAIQHAHQKGIIHRDIKPSNVLVTLYDDKPVPKVIDFGVAKAVESRLTEKTLFTQFGAMVGTFEYMSPEQADMNALGVDTRSDVYSLGVLLYEMLTGSTPLERSQLREAAFDEIVRRIKEEDPPKPSIRLSSSAALGKVAKARKTEPTKLSTLVRGELDWIVMRCLEKDRKRRYDGANDLAKDIVRYLTDEKVEACPPTLGYQVRKAYRRHRGAILTAAAFTAVLILATIASLWFAMSAQSAERLARMNAMESQHHRETAEQERKKAQERTIDANAVTDFLVKSVLSQADPYSGSPHDITLREALGKSVEQFEQQFSEPSLLGATIALRLGEVLSKTSEHWRDDKGRSLVWRGSSIRREMLGDEHRETLDAVELLIPHVPSDHNNRKERRRLISGLYENRKKILGVDHEDTLRAKSFSLGLKSSADDDLAESTASFDELQQEFDQLVTRQTELLGKGHPDVEHTIYMQAEACREQRRWNEAIPKYEQCLELCQQLTQNKNRRLLANMKGLYQTHLAQGNSDVCLQLIEDMSSISLPLLGNENQFNKYLHEQRFAILIAEKRNAELIDILKKRSELEGPIGQKAKESLCILYAWADDQQSHHDLSESIIDEHSDSTDAGILRKTARAVLISPDAASSLITKAVRFSERAAALYQSQAQQQEENWTPCWMTVVQSMAKYRLGDFKAASELVADVLEEYDVHESTKWLPAYGGNRWPTTALAFAAMSEQQLGNSGKAKKLLDEAEFWFENRMGGLYTHDQYAVLLTTMAIQQARDLIDGHGSDTEE